MKKYILILILCACYISNSLQAENLNLQKCIDIALQQNLNINYVKLRQEADLNKLWQAKAATLPSVNGYLNQGINTGKSINPFTNTFINQEINTGQYGVNANLNLFSGFSNINQMRQSMFTYKADEQDVKQANIDLSIQICMAYLQILSSQELLNQAQSQIEATQTQIERLSSLEKLDAIAPATLYDTKAQLANDKISLVNAKVALATSILNLSQIMNYTILPNTIFEQVPIENLATNNIIINDKTVDKLPATSAAELKYKSAVRGLRVAQGGVLPALSLVGNIGTNYSSAALQQTLTGTKDVASGDYINYNNEIVPVYSTQYNYDNKVIGLKSQAKNNLNTYLGLNVQIPLFNALNTQARMKNAKLAVKQTELEQKNTQTKYKALLNQAQIDASSALERFQIYEVQVSNYALSFEVAKIKFEKGALNTLDFIVAKTNIDKARANLIAAQYDLIFRNKVMQYYN